MKKALLFSLLFILATCVRPSPLAARQTRAPARPSQKAPAEPQTQTIKEVSVITEHSVHIGGQQIAYKATVGTIPIHDDQGNPTALIYYTSYTRTDEKNPDHRPIAFLYNGGPGSASIWLQMGAFGPRRVIVANAAPTGGAPYQLVNNQYSLLDVCDLVFIDPVGTGFSHAVGKAKNADFWGVDQDVASLAKFINNYVTLNNRWNSPKFLIGESYGTFRSAALVNYLQNNDGMYFNGVVLLSSVLDTGTLSFPPGEDLAYILYLPSYAAAAYYHHMLSPQPADLTAFLQEVRRFAETKYAAALLKGARLTKAQKSAMAAQISHFTGLSQDYVLKGNLRVTLPQFMVQLQRKRGLTTGRLDARFSGPSFDPLAEYESYDPQSTATTGAFTAAWQYYLRNELKYKTNMKYFVSANFHGHRWDWKHRGNEGYGFPGYGNVEPDLVQAMVTNPHLKIQVESGYYDLATPFFEAEYTMDHLDLPASLRGNIQIEFYRSGHMIYLRIPSLANLKTNVAAFVTANSKGTTAEPASQKAAPPKRK